MFVGGGQFLCHVQNIAPKGEGRESRDYHPSFRYQGKCKLTLEAIGTLMTNEERLLLTATAKNTFELFSDRDDMLIGTVVALLDLYRKINGRKPVVTQFEIRTGAVL
jgi:hypothetical protein